MPLMLRPSLAGLRSYPLGESQVPGVSRVINLASNENAVPPSAKVLGAARAALAEANRYPETSAAVLREKLARTHGLRADRIVCANGSSEMISLLAHSYTSPGDEVLIGHTGYLFFATAARVAGATPVRAKGRGLGFSVDAALAAVTPRTRILFVDNPNNPTGTHLDGGEICRLRRALRENILLVLDAAYAEYVTDPAYDAGAALVDGSDNCVMLRTFSKIYGLAGLRVGWAYAPADVADTLNRVRQPNSLAGVSIAAADAALDEPERLLQLRSENARLRDEFSSALSAMGLEVRPSQGNFVLVRFPDDDKPAALDVFEGLKRMGVIIRPMHPYGLPDCLRVTIGSAEEMAAATEAVRAVWASVDRVRIAQ